MDIIGFDGSEGIGFDGSDIVAAKDESSSFFVCFRAFSFAAGRSRFRFRDCVPLRPFGFTKPGGGLPLLAASLIVASSFSSSSLTLGHLVAEFSKAVS